MAVIAGQAKTDMQDDYRAHSKAQAELSRAFLRRNALLNLIVRMALYLAALVVFVLLVWYLRDRADAMAGALLGDESDWWRTFMSVLVPVAALFVIFVAMVVLAARLQTRNIADFERVMEGVSRIARDSTGVTRTRNINLVIEETLHKARRSFALQLWLGRTLFIAALLLVVSFAVYSMATRELDLISGALAAGSIISFAVASVTNQSDKVGDALANVTQLELVAMTTAERVGVSSEAAYQILEADQVQPHDVDVLVTKLNAMLRQISLDAMNQIQDFAEPGVVKANTNGH